MPAANCPPPDQLSAFLVGRLSDAGIESVAEHLELCPVCREAIETLEMQGDTLASQLRLPATAQPLPISAACERAMAAAEVLLADSSPSAMTAATLVTPGVLRIRDYRIVEKLGQGGMGAVYKAIHERLERMVAIKVLTPDRLRDSQAVLRFQREMKAVGKLQHPNIVNAHDAGEAEGTHFLVMEYVDGVDLQALVTRLGPLPMADACELIRQAALGLQHVHEHGLIHRDIKPSNLMLTTAGQVKILDLGLALLHNPQQPTEAELTGTSQFMGTADYVSPEQAENTHGVDIRADLYSLGCTLYKLLSGQAPFSGKEFDTPLKKVVAHLQRTPLAIASLRPDLPAELIATLDRLLAKEPAARHSTPAEVAAELAQFTAGSDLAQLAERAVAYASAGHVARRTPLESPPVPATGIPEGTTNANLSLALAETDAGATQKSQVARTRWWRNRRAQFAAGALAAILLLLGILISVKTPVGTIVLVIDQAEIAGAEVTVDDQKKITIRTGIGEEPVEVTPDEKTHMLKVSKGGFETFTREFTVRKGKNPPIEVRLVPSDAKGQIAGKVPSDKTGWHGWPVDAPAPAIAPFNAEQAKEHQEAWATYLGVPVEHTNSIGMKFRLIPPGEFVMGRKADELKRALETLSPEWETWRPNYLSEGPQHLVVLTQPVYVGIHEVTQGDYRTVMGRNPSYFSATGPAKEHAEKVAGVDTNFHPVENVTWNDAAEFCAELSMKEKLQPSYARAGETVTELKGNGYRLPTEAEWECACRAGTTTKWWSGDHMGGLTAVAWMKWNSGGRTHAVGELPANPFGLYDTYGNVWEWVDDRWEQAYYEQFAKTPAIDPRGPESGSLLRVIRGSAWFDTAANSSNKAGAAPRTQREGWGFRVALPVDGARQVVKSTTQPKAAGEPDRVVDLLKRVDVDRDAVKGKWTLSPEGLTSDGSVPFCRLKLPYAPPAEYDFRIEFSAQGGNDILQLFWAGDRGCTWLMGAWGGRHDGFDLVKDHPLTRDGTNIVGGPTSVRRGQRHTSVIQVRRDSIAARIDGKLVIRHASDGADLSMPAEWSIGEKALGLGTTFDTVVFHKVELVVPATKNEGAAWHGWPGDAPQPAIAPFTATEAKAHQEAWAAYLNVPPDYENPLGMKFRFIPPGKFVMGRSPRDAEIFRSEKLADDDLPAHTVTLTQPFMLGITEVTQGQWKELMGTTPWLGQKMAVDDARRPATYVSWFDAEKFCRRLSEREGEAFRLPTEAEWEYACRAGTTTAFSFGDTISQLSDHAWTRVNSHDLPQPVATKKPNPWGLFDMHGNAWEWCDARFSPYPAAAVIDPQSAGEGRFRPLRGGCFWSVPNNDYRSAVRRRWPEGLGYPESGFRVVRALRKAQ